MPTSPVSLIAPEKPATAGIVRPRLAGHFRIMRLDHSIKQAFILPGVLLAMALTGKHLDSSVAVSIGVGLIAATLVSSSNYVINEMLDAPFDRLHPIKKNRPAA